MREWKKLLSLNLALCMVLSLMPLGAWAAEEDEVIEPAVEEIIEPMADEGVEPMADYGDDPDGGDPTPAIVANGICGANLTWTLNEDGTLTISGEGAMYGYDYNAQPWCDYRGSIKKVVVEEGVTSIGQYAFYNCDALIEIELSEGLKSINSYAFQYCDGLIEIELPNGLASIGRNTFENCENLAKASVPESVTDIGIFIFSECAKLSEVILEDGLKGITDYMFEGCTSLTEIDLPESLTAIGYYAFKNTGLLSIDIPDGVTSIGSQAFRGNTSLTSVTIGSGIKNINSMAFAECTALETVTIDNYEAMVDVAEDAFPGATVVTFKELTDDSILYTWEAGDDATANLYANGLLKIEGSGVVDSYAWTSSAEYRDQITKVEIADEITELNYRAFRNCYDIKEVTIGSGITFIDNQLFSYCEALETVHFNNYRGMVEVENGAFSEHTVVTYKEAEPGTVLYTWEIGAYDETDATATLYADGLLTIEGKGGVSKKPWSKYNGIITKVEIGEDITSLPNSSFSECTSLTYVDLGGLTEIENYIFEGCTKLESIEGLEKITWIGDSAFYDCTALQIELVGNNLTYIGRSAFYNSGIKSIDITGDDLLIDNNVFVGCENLKSVRIDGDIWEVGSKAFANCPNLSEIYWNASVRDSFGSNSNLFLNSGKNTDGMTVTFGPDVTEIPAYMFYTSSNYAGQEPKIVSVAAEGEIECIGAFAFYRCADLATVELGDSLQYIEDGAFNSCSALTAVDLPMDMLEIGAKTFFRSGLTEIDLGSEVAFIGENAFGECAEGFTIRGFADSYAQEYAEANGIPFALLDNIGLLTLFDNHRYSNYSRTTSDLIGESIDLYSYSQSAQRRYFKYASSANLVAWNTKADGSGESYATGGEITMEEAVDLYGQWETMQFTVGGESYPVDQKASGDGWAYDGERTLYLDGYQGKKINLPRGFYIKTSGEVKIIGGIWGTEDLHIEVTDGKLMLTGGSDMLALTANDVELIANGEVFIDNTMFGIQAIAVYMTGTKNITIQASASAVSRWNFNFADSYKLYLSKDAVECANAYDGGKYLRLEPDVYSMSLHANGGRWSDQNAQIKVIESAGGEEVWLGAYADQLSRKGYLLNGWSDLQDNEEYGLYSYASSADLILYAKWIEQSLTIDGTTYTVDEAHSGTGWSYTPGIGRNTATLTITEGYNGGAISCTKDLTLNIYTSVILTGKTNLPAIKVFGDLELNIAEGNVVSIYGGSGESAISSRGEVSIDNYGDLSIYGGAGGLGIDTWTNLYSDGAMSIVGGLHSPAVDGLAIENCAGTITLVAGANANHAFNSWADAEGLAMKFYVGANASNAIRDDLYSAKYVRIQPKTIIVTLDANGGSFDGMALNTMEVAQDEGNAFTLRGEQPAQAGYAFEGWNTKLDGSGETYAAGETFVAEANADSIVLYAQWKDLGDVAAEITEMSSDHLIVVVSGTAEVDLYVAVYDVDGRMLGVSAGQALTASGTACTVGFDGKADHVKVFGAQNGVPLEDAILLEIE